MNIAVIIPTLNEQANVARTIRLLQRRGTPDQLIVADCGSADQTRAIAESCGACLTTASYLPHRAAAMSAGAALARAIDNSTDVLWFLHADTVPPKRWRDHIESTLSDANAIAGAFDFAWDLRRVSWPDAWMLRLVSLINRTRFRLTRSFFGDQGIFVTHEAFDRIGGFEHIALLEDVRLCRAHRRIGRLAVAPARVKTSPRRFVHHGVVRQAMIDLLLLSTERMGLTLQRTYDWYNNEKA